MNLTDLEGGDGQERRGDCAEEKFKGPQPGGG